VTHPLTDRDYVQVWACSWSPDGTKVVSCSRDKTVRVWDANRGECVNTLTGHDDEVSLPFDGLEDCKFMLCDSFIYRLTE
jgi:WD40 repeat protein